MDLLDLLGHVNIVRVEGRGKETRFLITLWGTGVTYIYDGDYTGRYVDEVFQETELGSVHASYQQIVDSREPHFWKILVPEKDRGFMSYRRLALPFGGEEDGVVTDIMLLILPDDAM